eukprot:3897114-Rhodomonas_salina.1
MAGQGPGEGVRGAGDSHASTESFAYVVPAEHPAAACPISGQCIWGGQDGSTGYYGRAGGSWRGGREHEVPLAGLRRCRVLLVLARYPGYLACELKHAMVQALVVSSTQYRTAPSAVPSASSLRACYAVSGTELASSLRACYAMSGTELAYGRRCSRSTTTP